MWGWRRRLRTLQVLEALLIAQEKLMADTSQLKAGIDQVKVGVDALNAKVAALEAAPATDQAAIDALTSEVQQIVATLPAPTPVP